VAKVYKVNLGGEERELRYTRAEREEFEEQFNGDMLELIRTKVAPTDEEGKIKSSGMLKVQTALVFYGLRHYPRVTKEKVAQWIDKAYASGGNPYSIYGAAINAVMASGVLGFSSHEEDDEKAEEPEGKD